MSTDTDTTTMTEADLPKLHTAKQMADHYGVALCTFLKWFHEGIVPAALAIGNTTRYDAEQVAAAIEAHTRKINAENARRAKQGKR